MSTVPDRDRKLPRLKDRDYSDDGAYFVTICTENRENIFGEIKNGKMILNKLGRTAEKFWHEIPDHFPDTRLDEFVVMPNHIHGIVWIERPAIDTVVGNKNHNANLVGNEQDSDLDVSADLDVGNGHARSLQKKTNLSNIVGSFKSAVSKIIRRENPDTYSVWQKSFFDRVIRDEDELNRIRDYIQQNPRNWEEDEYRPE